MEFRAQPGLVAGDLLDGRYRIAELLGEGGYGRVFRAVQLPLERDVAIKIVNGYDSELVARFAREAAVIRSLEHPNTVRVLDVGTTPSGEPFLVLELLRGRDLDAVLEQRGSLTPDEALSITAQVLKSLVEAHEKGIVHRDVKPGNVFITSHAGEPMFVKLLDFGIAKQLRSGDKLTAVGEALGTPSYMAPEQALGQSIDARTDLYAVGLMLAEMVTGKLVFAKGGPLTILDAQMGEAPVPLSREVLDSVVGPIVVRAVKKDPRERYQSAADMLNDVEATRHRLASAAGPTRAVLGSAAPYGRAASLLAAQATVPAPTRDGSAAAQQTFADLPFAPPHVPSPEPQPIAAPIVIPRSPVGEPPRRVAAGSPRSLIIGMGVVIFALAAALVVLLAVRRDEPNGRTVDDDEEIDPSPKRTQRPVPTTSAPVVARSRLRNMAELKRAFREAGYTLTPQDGPEDALFYSFTAVKDDCVGTVARTVAVRPDVAEGAVKSLRESPDCRPLREGLVVVYVCFGGKPAAACVDAAAKLLVKETRQ